MVKGVFLALGIMLVLAAIPIVDLVGIPFGPFIGSYYGISSAGMSGNGRPEGRPLTGSEIGAYAVKSAVFGILLGLLVLLILVAVGASLMATIDLSQRFTWLLWLAIVVFTVYTATMSTLGAMYSQVKAAK